MTSAETADSKGKGPSQATKLVELADQLVDIVAGNGGRVYAVLRNGPRVAFPLKGGSGLRSQLAHWYMREFAAVPSQSALTDATAVLEGRAMDLDPQPIHLRLATHTTTEGRGIVLDLGTADGRCVIATPAGWTISERAPVLFRRTRLTSVLPDPGEPGQTEHGLNALRGLLNVDEPTFRLIVGWLITGLMPDMPHPILAAKGEQGTGKSTAMAMIVNLIDPSPAPLRSLPRDQKTWATLAAASWAVCLDNVSTIQTWLSDTLCKAVTGEGYVDRSLYSDDDVSVLAFRRLLAMTSIDPGALASDLAERMVTAEFQPIKRDQRRGDAELQDAYHQAAPAILAALLDLLAGVLAHLPRIDLPELPRMADFARTLAALDIVAGWETFETYQAAAETNTADLIDAKPFTSAVADTVESAGTWTGTISQLMDLVTVPDPRPKSWPIDATRASGQLKRDAPVLRAIGISFAEAGRGPAPHRSRLYQLATQNGEPPEHQRSPAEPAPDVSATSTDALFSAGGTTPAPGNAAESAFTPAVQRNPSSHRVLDGGDAMDTTAEELSRGDHPTPVESGQCPMCEATFERAYATAYGPYCSTCAIQRGRY